MKGKTIIKHIFFSLLFCMAWDTVCWSADEFTGGPLAEKFYDLIKELPYGNNPDDPVSFAFAFFIYPMIVYLLGVTIWYVLSKQFRKQ